MTRGSALRVSCPHAREPLAHRERVHGVHTPSFTTGLGSQTSRTSREIQGVHTPSFTKGLGSQTSRTSREIQGVHTPSFTKGLGSQTSRPMNVTAPSEGNCVPSMFCLLLHRIHAWARTVTILGENAFSSSSHNGSLIVIGLVTFGTVSVFFEKWLQPCHMHSHCK